MFLLCHLSQLSFFSSKTAKRTMIRCFWWTLLFCPQFECLRVFNPSSYSQLYFYSVLCPVRQKMCDRDSVVTPPPKKASVFFFQITHDFSQWFCLRCICSCYIINLIKPNYCQSRCKILHILLISTSSETPGESLLCKSLTFILWICSQSLNCQ